MGQKGEKPKWQTELEKKLVKKKKNPASSRTKDKNRQERSREDR